MLVLPEGWEFEPGYRLASALPVRLEISASGVIATTHLETAEYGCGSTQDEALDDLMSSLVEYMESLEARRERLSKTSLLDLDRLYRLVEKTND